MAFPLLELYGIVRVWGLMGAWTLAWLLLAVLAGAALIAVERVAFLPGVAASVLAGDSPLTALKTSGLRFLAGILLILPGVMSDVLAVLLLLWAGLRPIPAPVPPPGPRPQPGAGPGPRTNARTGDDVIEGEYRRID